MVICGNSSFAPKASDNKVDDFARTRIGNRNIDLALGTHSLGTNLGGPLWLT